MTLRTQKNSRNTDPSASTVEEETNNVTQNSSPGVFLTQECCNCSKKVNQPPKKLPEASPEYLAGRQANSTYFGLRKPKTNTFLLFLSSVLVPRMHHQLSSLSPAPLLIKPCILLIIDKKKTSLLHDLRSGRKRRGHCSHTVDIYSE